MLVLVFTLILVSAPAWGQEKGWERKWDETLARARKEGKVVVAGSPDPVFRNEVIPKFQARFGVPVELIAGRSSDIGARVRTERQAGIYSLDAFLPGLRSTTTVMYPEKMLDPLKPVLILPDVVSPAKWKKGKLWFIDPTGESVLRVFSSVNSLFHINTDHVKPGELRTAQDLLNPKWKGKISTDDPTAAGRGANTAALFYAHFGEEFVKRLYVDQKPVISRNRRQLADGLARGTHPIALSVPDDDAAELRKEGFPVVEVYDLADLPGVLSGGPYVLTLANKAPHPNAAQIFVNWMASKEATEIYSRGAVSATLRTDVDESFLPPKIVPRPGVRYFDSYDWQWTATVSEEARLLVKKLLEK